MKSNGSPIETSIGTSKHCPRYAKAASLLFGRLGLLVDC
jgi:hypothetical protein